MMPFMQLLLLAAVAHAQSDLPYPLQLVRLSPSGVPPSLYEKNQQHDSIVPGAPPREYELPGSSEEMSQFHSQDAAGRSLFGYMLPDQMRIEARRPDGTVRGSYIYRDASGQAFKVQYWDEGQGFHAAGSHLPGMSRDLPQPAQDTPEVEAARKQHLAAYQQVLQRQLELLYHHQQPEQQQQQQAGPPEGEVYGDGVVVESDPAAPPHDQYDDGPGQRYPALSLVPALYDPSHVHDAGRDAVVVDSAGARHVLQGSTFNARENVQGSAAKLGVLGWEHPHNQNVAKQRFIIVYADKQVDSNGIEGTEDGRSTPKHVRSVQQGSITSNSTVNHNNRGNDARRSRRGRISIYDYIAERDPERMARNFPESYLIQQIFNSNRTGDVDDDSDALQRAAEREFQFLKKIGKNGHERTTPALLAADVSRSRSDQSSETIYKAGVMIPDFTYFSVRSGATTQESALANNGVRRGGNRGFVDSNYNHNIGLGGMSRDTPQGNIGSEIINGESNSQNFTNRYDENRGKFDQGLIYIDNKSVNKNTPNVAVDISDGRLIQGYHTIHREHERIPHNYFNLQNTFTRNANYPVYHPEHIDLAISKMQDTQSSPLGPNDNLRLNRQQSSVPKTTLSGLRNEHLSNDNRKNYETRIHIQQPGNYHEELFPLPYTSLPESPNERNPSNSTHVSGNINRAIQRTNTNRKMNGTFVNRSNLPPPTVTPLNVFHESNTSTFNVESSQKSNLFDTEALQREHLLLDLNSTALFYKTDGDSDDSYRDKSEAFSDSVNEPQISGHHHSPGSIAYQPQAAHRTSFPGAITNVGGFPPVAMQYYRGGNIQQDGSKEAVVLDNLIGRSASSKARSLDVSADGRGTTGSVAEVKSPAAATKEELVSEAVAAAASISEKSTDVGNGNVEHATKNIISGSIRPPQQSIISMKDGPAESYSAIYMQPGRQAKGATDLSYSVPQPQMEGGFFYTFHHPVIPVAVQLGHQTAIDSPGRVASADVRSPPRGLSVSQRASLYDAVPVAAVHDAQVPPYLRGAISDHQTKPIFIHYDPAEVSAAT